MRLRAVDAVESGGPARPLLAALAVPGDAAGDGVDRRPPDHGFGGVGVAFVVRARRRWAVSQAFDGPCWPASLRTMCSVVARTVVAQSSRRPAKPLSAKRNRTRVR